ncbi:MAG: deaminase [Parvibaculum sp.]|uniref:deoxycytidylate deaminase n=1 Tax=Parvibaculum sp. TaxID=2024848 RepID=UPI0032EBF42D
MLLSSTDCLFLMQCEVVKGESHDPSRQVGAVIASPAGHLLATGSNRPPEVMRLTQRDSVAAIKQDPDWKYFMLEHAERNAINNARELGHSLVNATMYGTLFPCADCARAIAVAGIRRLVVPSPERNRLGDKRWEAHFYYARMILDMAGVQLDFFQPEDINSIELGNDRSLGRK